MTSECTIGRQNDRMVVVPEGDMDVDSTEALRRILVQIVERRECRRIFVPPSGMPYSGKARRDGRKAHASSLSPANRNS
jgi:hypothetical protein